MVSKEKIWLDMQQINELNDNLQRMFVSTNDEFGEFITYLQKNKKVAIYPIFTTKWKMTDQVFKLITRVSEKYDNIKMCGSLITCNLSQDKQITFRPQLTKKK
eukprot:510597_1